MRRARRTVLIGGFATVFVAAVVSPVLAKGKPPATGAGCRPQVTVVLKGTLAATPGATATSISVNTTHANHHGSAYVKLGQPISVAVDAKTKVRRQGQKTLGDLRQGDAVVVRARVCKADLASGTPHLTATSIVAHDASHASDAGDQGTAKNEHPGKGENEKDDDGD
jgi:hypothetical protein